jgi:hypothetical protein
MRITPSAVPALCWVLTALVWGGACAGRRAVDTETLARVRFENLTDVGWEIRLVRGPGVTRAGAADKTLQIPAKEVVVVEVAAGDYRVRAEPRAAEGAFDTWALRPDGEAITLSAGRIYVWPLSTLLSETEAGR